MIEQRSEWFARYAVPLLWAAAIIFTLAYGLNFRLRGPESIIWSDAEGYYMYLPAVFIHGGFEDLPLNTNTGQFRVFPGTNKIFNKYTYGVAVLQLPFFGAAHVIASASGQYPADGHSLPYIFALLIAGFFYGFWGLILLRDSLRDHFRGVIPDIIVLSILLGTNLLYYTVGHPGMSHVFSFFLFCAFIRLTHCYYQKDGSWLLAAGLALVLAWSVLIRPTNILLVLYFLFYSPNERFDLKDRFHFLRRRFGQLLLFPLMGFLAFIPQMAYWHYMTGSYIYYSYRNIGFSYWNAPRLGPVLFSIKNGWLLFSPLMGLSVIAAIAGSVKNAVNSRVIGFIWLAAWYAFSSWEQWWFGGAFGHRAFVEFYALLAFPLAWLVQRVLALENRLPKILFFALWLLLIYYSLGLTDHYRGPHYDWGSWRSAMEMMFTF